MENKVVDRLTKLQEHVNRYNQLYSQLKEDIRPIKRQSISIWKIVKKYYEIVNYQLKIFDKT